MRTQIRLQSNCALKQSSSVLRTGATLIGHANLNAKLRLMQPSHAECQLRVRHQHPHLYLLLLQFLIHASPNSNPKLRGCGSMIQTAYWNFSSN
jgi:hypothetical protein